MIFDIGILIKTTIKNKRRQQRKEMFSMAYKIISKVNQKLIDILKNLLVRTYILPENHPFREDTYLYDAFYNTYRPTDYFKGR